MTPIKQPGRVILPETEADVVKLQNPETRRKRVYTSVAVVNEAGGFGISLDGRPLHTPGRTKLETSSESLAKVIAKEWDDQVEYFDPTSMPLTKLLNTALDRISPNMEAVVEDLLSYLDTDLLCYRADGPAELVERQNSVWQPILDWLADTHSVILSVGAGLMPLSHLEKSHIQAEKVVSALNTIELTTVQAVAGLTSSLSLGLALVNGKVSGAEVAAAATLDEVWQMEKWGEDQEALDRITNLAGEVRSVEKFLKLSA
ncbi:MAG: ATP12 family protein [Rhodospirillaceae bacterium]|nr:ATP12 family protein [Rhodospirillaceae bacterium]